MNKRIDLTKLGGYPLAQEDLDWLQSSYRSALAAIADLCGDKVIITGMQEAGGSVTAGWIAIGGELVPFAAGAIGTGEFTITETVTPLTFDDGISKDVLYERVANFSGGGAYQYADLVRIDTLKTKLCPAGMIVMWSGDVGDIPAGWALCDGTGGTPNLKGKFIVGYDNTDADYDAIGDAGGAKEVTLTSAQQGSFTVRQLRDDITGGSASVTAQLTFNGVAVPLNGGSNQSSLGDPLTVNLSAATDPTPTRPPYYTLAYIIKL